MSQQIIMPDRSIAPAAPSLNIQIDAQTLVKLMYEEFKKVALEKEREIETLRARIRELER